MIRLRIGLAVACLLLLGCMATAPAAAAQTRRALLVGIDDYDAVHAPSCPATPPGGTPCRCDWRDLRGSVNDAKAMQQMLTARYGFRPQDVKVLTDREATREKILAAIRSQLIEPARPGDEVFFFYAGHGSQVKNSLSDEPDKLDETIVPADARRGAPDIRDKELRRLFDEILDRKARLTVIFDSCHSGSAGRGYPPGGRARRLPQDCRDVADRSPTGPPPEQRGALVLSASQDDQLALEAYDPTTKAHHGAFTLALLEAMGREGPQAPAGEVFLRAKARMQTITTGSSQEPVLAGARQSEPLFGSGAIRSSREAVHTRGEAVVAVAQVDPAGIVYLQGGWASGLGEGSELEELAPAKNGSPLRLRVTAAKEPVRSEARILGPARAAALPKTGDLFRLVRWTLASKPGLRVWIPETGEPWKALRDRAVAFRGAVRTAGHAWVTDPVAETPTHVLSWEHGAWMLHDPAGRTTDLGAAPSPAALVNALASEKRRPARLFVHLPAAQDLAQSIHLGQGTENDAVEKTAGPEDADYYLIGRLNGETPEFAWVHPAVGTGSSAHSSLPARTDWFPLPPGEGAAKDGSAELGGTLEDKALRLAKIHAWLTLDSPPGEEFPYHLALLDSEKRKVAPKSPLPAGATYGLALEAQPKQLGKSVTSRYVYVFAINSTGASILMLPRNGNVENHFPLPSGTGPLAEILLGTQPSFRIAEPFGTDTYFLLTTNEAVPDPWVLEYPGVRKRGPQGRTPLEELLSQRGSTSRRSPPPSLPATWSLEKLTFESTPPRPAP
ncbi:MAG TPA: caspase family protein [Thermoanaerobaculia bacterium]|nr:caspase family protein [Thermoanaerobaculia bacterium]